MKRTLAATAALAVACVAGVAAAASVTVQLTPTGPSPTGATIGTGETVTFANATPQPITLGSKRGGIPPTVLAPGQLYGRVYTAPGSYTYQENVGHGSFRGSVVVTTPAPVGSATLRSSKRAVTFGQHIVLHGHSPIAGAPVSLQTHHHGSQWTTVTLKNTIEPAHDGTFTITLTPKLTGSYRLAINTGGRKPLYSSETDVDVRAGIRMSVTSHRAASGHSITVRVHVTPSNATTSVTLQHFNRDRGAWARVSDTRVNARNGNAVFSWPVLQGPTRIRATMSRRTVHEGLVPATSPWTIVTGVGAPPTPPKHHHK
jgi:hypothetical protein